ncbi:MAG: PAS domain S-box protein [Nitrospinae bacterium]|nr:PAS domain S-box protein [Nitrospinota bacterium]
MNHPEGGAPTNIGAPDVKMLVERVRLLYGQAKVALIANLVNPVIVMYVQWDAVAHEILVSWAAALWFVTLYRWGTVLAFRKQDINESNAALWKNRFAAETFVSGLLWGVTGVLFMTGEMVSHQWFTVFVLGGMAAGAVVYLSIVMEIYSLYVVPLIIPAAIKLFTFGDEVHVAAGLLIVVFVAIMWGLATRINRTFTDTLALRFEKNDLIAALIAEKKTANSLNQGLMEEVNERKRAEEAAIESEARFRRIAEASFEGIVISRERKFLDVNTMFTSMFGYSREELQAMTVLELTAPEYRATVVANIASGFDRPYEILGLRKDGSTFPVEVRGKAAYFKGLPARITVLRDLTDRKLAEEAIKRSEERLRVVTSAASDAIIMIDASGKVDFWNPAAEKMFGYTQRETLGVCLSTIIIPEKFRSAHLNGLAAFSEKGDGPVIGKTIEITGLRKNGEEFPLELSIASLKMAEGWKAIGVARDITERKAAELALKESEKRYRTVANYTFDWENWRGPDGKMIYVSPSCQRISGYSSEEFAADPLLEVEIAHPDDRMAINKHFRVMRNLSETSELEYRIITKSGEERWIHHCCMNVYDEQGGWLGRRASNRDITERKKAEERLVEVERNLMEAQKIARIGSWNLDIMKNRLSLSEEMRMIFDVDSEMGEGALAWLFAVYLRHIHPEDKSKVALALDLAISEFNNFDIDFRLVRPDGAVRHVRSYVKIFRGGGRISGAAAGYPGWRRI